MDAGSVIIAVFGVVVGGIIILGLIIAIIVWMNLAHRRRMQELKSGKDLAKALDEQRELREEIAELRDRLNQRILEDERDVHRRLNA